MRLPATTLQTAWGQSFFFVYGMGLNHNTVYKAYTGLD